MLTLRTGKYKLNMLSKAGLAKVTTYERKHGTKAREPRFKSFPHLVTFNWTSSGTAISDMRSRRWIAKLGLLWCALTECPWAWLTRRWETHIALLFMYTYSFTIIPTKYKFMMLAHLTDCAFYCLPPGAATYYAVHSGDIWSHWLDANLANGRIWQCFGHLKGKKCIYRNLQQLLNSQRSTGTSVQSRSGNPWLYFAIPQ